MRRTWINLVRTGSLWFSTGLAVATLCLIMSGYDGLRFELQNALGSVSNESFWMYFSDPRLDTDIQQVQSLDAEGLPLFRSPNLDTYLPSKQADTAITFRAFQADELTTIEHLSSVAAVGWQEYQPSFVVTSGVYLPVIDLPLTMLDNLGLRLDAGRFPPAPDTESQDVVLGATAAHQLFGAQAVPLNSIIEPDQHALPDNLLVPPSALGGQISSYGSIEPYRLRVVGVLEPSPAHYPASLPQYDHAILRVIQKPTYPVVQVFVQPQPGQQAAAIAAIKQHIALPEADDLQLHIDPLADTYQQQVMGRFLDLVRQGLVWVVVLALLLAIVTVGLGSILSILLRYREIGIRRSIGATRRQLAGQFLAESLRIGLIGLVLGLLLTWAAQPVIASLTGVAPRFGMLTIVAAVGISVLLSVITTVWMARRAMRLAPAPSLRQQTGMQLHRRRWLIIGPGMGLSILALIVTLALRDGLRTRMDEILGWTGERTIGFVPWTLPATERSAAYISTTDYDALHESFPTWSIGFLGTPVGELMPASASLSEVRPMKLQRGRWFNPDEEDGKSFVVVLGSAFARELAASRNMDVSQLTTFRGQEIIGILDDWELMVGAGFSPYKIYVPLGSQLRPEGSVIGNNEPAPKGQVFITVPADVDLGQAAVQLKDLLQQRHPEGEPQMLLPANVTQAALQRRNAIYNVVSVFAGLCLLIGGIGLLNLTFVSVLSRAREIGVRRALGATRRRILGQILGEVVRLCLGAALLGAAAGLAIARVVQVRFGWPPTTPWELIGLAAGVAVLVGLAAGLLPAWWAANLPPTRAIKAE